MEARAAASTAPALVAASVSPYPPDGGGEKRTLRLLETMVRAGAAPHLVVPGDPQPDVSQALGERGILIEGVADPAATPVQRAYQHLRRLPAPYRPAVAHRLTELSHEWRPAFVQLEHTENACYRSLPLHAPVVLSFHNVDSQVAATLARAHRPGTLQWLRLANRARSTRRTERRGAREADAILCASDEDAAQFAQLGIRAVVVPNGVDDEFFRVEEELPQSAELLFFGRLDYEPNALGIARFVKEGWPAVRSRLPHARLRIAGRGAAGALAAKLRGVGGVEILGPVADIAAELARASAVVVPIWHGGGTRLKVLESLAAARPVAGTPLGVAALGFEHGRHGLVAESAVELAGAAIALIEDRPRACRLAAEGRVLAQDCRWSSVTRPAEKLYRELVDRRDAMASPKSRS